MTGSPGRQQGYGRVGSTEGAERTRAGGSTTAFLFQNLLTKGFPNMARRRGGRGRRGGKGATVVSTFMAPMHKGRKGRRGGKSRR